MRYSFLSFRLVNFSGHAVCSWLGLYATAGSIPDEVIGIFSWPNKALCYKPEGLGFDSR
jgi:hypothetical protein